MRLMIFLISLFLFASLAAQTLYKSKGPNGEVIYSAIPPADSRVEKTLDYVPGPSSPLPDYVVRFKEEMQRKVQQHHPKAGSNSGAIQLFTTSWCGFCRKARTFLDQKQIAYIEHDIETPAGMQALLQVGEEGRRGVPILVWQDQKIYGFSESNYETLFSKRR
jgi:glutaredoxin